VPAPSVGVYGGGGGYGGYGGYTSGTAAGSALTGMASVISAKGDYNLSTSAATVNMTQAQRNEIQNRQLYTDTYFQMRATNRAAREAERGPPPARDGVPKPLTTSELDPVTGQLYWPNLLRSESFDPDRAEVDQLFAKRSSYGELTYSEQRKARNALYAMFDQLKAQIQEVSMADYIVNRKFLNSVLYTAAKSQL
jgi:hypothetical protein